jgi:cbb3-type cytochrome oxidase maturation protein
MDILYLLIPLAVLIMIVAVAAFIWAVKNGQYEDLEGPAHRILMDDDDPRIPSARPVDKSDEMKDDLKGDGS